MNTNKTSQLSCDGDCHSCGAWATLGMLHGPDALSGWKLVGLSLAIFIFPLVVAGTGAALLRNHGGWQALGAFGGLILGAGSVSLILRCFRCRERNDAS